MAMPLFNCPTLYNHQPIVSSMLADKIYVRPLKKKIFEEVLWASSGSVLVRIGTCDLNKRKVDSEVTQEALSKLKTELGQLGISISIITGELDLITHRYPVYILASNNAHKTKVPR